MRRAWEETGTRQALVIPAFERTSKELQVDRQDCAASVDDITADSECWMYLDYEVPLTKDALRRAVEQHQIVEDFHVAKVPVTVTCCPRPGDIAQWCQGLVV